MAHDLTTRAERHLRPARAGVLDTVRCAGLVLAPIVAQGAIRRRNRVVRLVRRLDLDRRGARLLRGLRARHGDGPLRLALPGRPVALVLDEAGVERVLAGSPEPFALATREKVAALRHFQPHGVLISTGSLRQARRHFNETVLDAGAPLHRAAGAIAGKVRDEVERFDDGRILDWPAFAAMFDRIARRVVLGDAARDDIRVTAELNRLRAAANWAYLRPRQEGLRQRFQRRIDAYVARAEPGTLAGTIAGTPAVAGVDPAGQVPHWLFAFDAAGMSAFRTLALLGSDAGRQGTAARDEAPLYPFVRACVQDTVRLWPTTLVVLRESTAETDWHGASLPAGTSFVLPSSYFHRDETTMHQADEFAPEVWLSGGARRSWSVFPFSAGPGACPGRNVVLLTTSTLIAVLLNRLGPLRTLRPLRTPLPRTLDHTGLRLELRG
ncbi:cytochrome P450 [Dactylosporangium sp. NPDC048998]|uniref:cytochrome P450 n=1 Tax=Dactylosporangium sp. NPDC048998 TaxID=3363976 RepID=UPI00371DAA90